MKLFRIFCAVGIGVALAGCAATKPAGPLTAPGGGVWERKTRITKPVIPKKGIYHKIRDGETLWRIAKTYNISVEELVKENNIPDAAQLEVNQLLFIPGATAERPIVQDADIASKEFMWPVKGKILDYFSKGLAGKPNRGIDIQAKAGAAVLASRTGKVVFADFLTGFGYTVILDHGDGFYSLYGNNAKLLVKLGDYVYKRTPIADVGKMSNRPSYLHFEIRKKDKALNPLHYLAGT